MEGTVTDDKLPDPPGAVTVQWSQAGGPGTATETLTIPAGDTVGYSDLGAELFESLVQPGGSQ